MPYVFFNDTATTEIYTLSLHDALPISLHLDVLAAVRYLRKNGAKSVSVVGGSMGGGAAYYRNALRAILSEIDLKSTRLNSSHGYNSYAVFCLQKQSCSPQCTRRMTIGI